MKMKSFALKTFSGAILALALLAPARADNLPDLYLHAASRWTARGRAH